MKKVILVMAAALLLMFSTVCLANATDSQISLGGIEPGCSGDYVIQIYGKPAHKVTRNADFMTLTTYFYGSPMPTVEVAVFTNSNTVHHIRSTGNNGFYTPDGLGVGMSESTVYRLYGRDGFTYNHDGVKYIEYGNSGNRILNVGIKDSKVVSISCSVYE